MNSHPGGGKDPVLSRRKPLTNGRVTRQRLREEPSVRSWTGRHILPAGGRNAMRIVRWLASLGLSSFLGCGIEADLAKSERLSTVSPPQVLAKAKRAMPEGAAAGLWADAAPAASQGKMAGMMG